MVSRPPLPHIAYIVQMIQALLAAGVDRNEETIKIALCFPHNIFLASQLFPIVFLSIHYFGAKHSFLVAKVTKNKFRQNIKFPMSLALSLQVTKVTKKDILHEKFFSFMSANYSTFYFSDLYS